MLRHKGLILLFLLVLIMLVVPFVHGDDEPGSHARIVRLSYVEGRVQVSHQQSNSYQNATMNVPLVQGDQVRTGDDGWAEIQFENGSNIRLAPESQLTFGLLTRFRTGATGTEVSLDEGEAEFAIAAGDDDGPFRVNVRQRTIALKSSSRFRVTTVNSDPLEVVVWRGEVGIFSADSGGEVAVKKHEVFTLDPLDAGHYNLDRDVQGDDLDRWASERDQYINTYANSNNNGVQVPYQYGTSDMNYYGQYYNVSGCGYCWQPYGVGLSWDPFMNGYWDNSPIGPTWISAYPWGWMPYRFGQWMFVPGFGWVWQPGLWNRWVSLPPVVNPPRGFRPPVPPTATAARSVDTPRVGNKLDGGPAHLTMSNPALSTTIGPGNRTVISNEHTLPQLLEEGNLVPPTSRGNIVRPVRHTPAPVETHILPLQPARVTNMPAPTVRVSTPQAGRPQTFSPPPVRSYTPPRPPAPAAHSSGGHR